MQYISFFLGSGPKTPQMGQTSAPSAATPEGISQISLPIFEYILIDSIEAESTEEAPLLTQMPVTSNQPDEKERTSLICVPMENSPATAKTEKHYSALLTQLESHAVALNFRVINTIFKVQIHDVALAEITRFQELDFENENIFDSDAYKKCTLDLTKLASLSAKLLPHCGSAENVNSLLQLALEPIDSLMREFLANPLLHKDVSCSTQRTISLSKSKKRIFTIERSEIISVVDTTSKVVLKTFKLINKIKIPSTELSARRCSKATTITNSIIHYMAD